MKIILPKQKMKNVSKNEGIKLNNMNIYFYSFISSMI